MERVLDGISVCSHAAFLAGFLQGYSSNFLYSARNQSDCEQKICGLFAFGSWTISELYRLCYYQQDI
jgi:hypothetical protein